MRSAAEIDAAKAVLNATDLGAVTSEVRQFPPGYVAGGRLRLNTNLQIEVAPIAINVAGRDVRIPETTIIGNEHWRVSGKETPRVAGSWYYLYLSSAAKFAVGPIAPAYNTLYFAYYHPEVSDLRAIGKFYFGSAGRVVYVQTSLEATRARVLIASSSYAGEDANYYCTGQNDQILLQAAINYLSDAHDGGLAEPSEGKFNLTAALDIGYSNIIFRGSGYQTILEKNCDDYAVKIIGTADARIEGVELSNLAITQSAEDAYGQTLLWVEYATGCLLESLYVHGAGAHNVLMFNCSDMQVVRLDTEDAGSIGLYGWECNDFHIDRCKAQNNGWGFFISYTAVTATAYSVVNCIAADNSFKGIVVGGWRGIVSGNICRDNGQDGISVEGSYNLVSNNSISNCAQDRSATTNYAGIRIYHPAYVSNKILNNSCKDNGNLIDRSTCNNSSTSPMIFGEAAPTASNCTWGFTSTGPYEGIGQYRFTKTAAAGTIAYLHLVDNVGAADLHGLIPGTQYEWGGWIKVAASASCGFQGFRLYQATTAAGAASAVAFTTATTGWQEVWVTATVYVGATTAYIGLVASASLATMSFDVDKVRLFPPGEHNVHNHNFYNAGTSTLD